LERRSPGRRVRGTPRLAELEIGAPVRGEPPFAFAHALGPGTDGDPLTRPSDTLSLSGGEGWGEGARFMGKRALRRLRNRSRTAARMPPAIEPGAIPSLSGLGTGFAKKADSSGWERALGRAFLCWHLRCLFELRTGRIPVHSLPMQSSARNHGEGITAVQGFNRRCDTKNLKVMSVYPKQSLPVQFLSFAVDQHTIIVPILHRSRDNFAQVHKEDRVQLASTTRQASVPVENLPRSS